MWQIDELDPTACPRCGRKGTVPAWPQDEGPEDAEADCPDCGGDGQAHCAECRRALAEVVELDSGRCWCTPCWVASWARYQEWRARRAEPFLQPVTTDDDLPF